MKRSFVRHDIFFFSIHDPRLSDFESNYIQKKLADNLRLSYLLSMVKAEGGNGVILNSLIEPLSYSGIKRKIFRHQPYLCLFSVNYLGLSNNLQATLSIIQKIKNDFPKIHISLEGTFSTLNYKAILNQYNAVVDSIIVGESEPVINKIIKAVISKKSSKLISGIATFRNGLVVYRPNHNPFTDLNKLPQADRSSSSKLSKINCALQVQTSRGCGSNCNFCYLNEYYRANGACQRRERSASNVIKEIESLLKQFSSREIWLTDEDFIGTSDNSQNRTREIASAIINKHIQIKLIGQTSARRVKEDVLIKLKKAGLKRLFVGVESSSQNFLNYLKKGLTIKQIQQALTTIDKVGIFCEIGFIMFHTNTTFSSIKQDIDFLYDQCVRSKKGYIQIYNLNLLVDKPDNQNLNNTQEKIDILSPPIKLIYLGISMFLLKTRRLTNIIREMSINSKAKPTLVLVKYNNKSIIACLKKMLCVVKSGEIKNEKEIYKIAEKERYKLYQTIISDRSISQIPIIQSLSKDL